MRKKLKKAVIIVVIVVIIALIAFSVYFLHKKAAVDECREEIGKQLVLALYDFYSPEQLDEQMRVVQLLTTEPVFNQLTIDNEERTLNTYLKFKNNPVTVEIIKSTENYVLYTLHTECLAEGRIFIFMFNVNLQGKVDWVREEECIDFY